MKTAPRILLADDDPRDVELFLLGLDRVNLGARVDVVHDGEAVVDYLYRRGAFKSLKGPQPKVLFLDLKMPKLDGIQVIRQIKADPALRALPVVAFTSSSQERDLRESYASGVNAYVVKPMDFGKLMQTVGELGTFWLGLNETEPAQI